MLREVKLKEDELVPGVPIKNGQLYGGSPSFRCHFYELLGVDVLGISYRIWLIVVGGLGLLSISRLLLSNSPSLPTTSTASA